jgi:hypothetical protein
LNINGHFHFFLFINKSTVNVIGPNVLALYTNFSFSIHYTAFYFFLPIPSCTFFVTNTFDTRTDCALSYIKIYVYFNDFDLFFYRLKGLCFINYISIKRDLLLYLGKLGEVFRQSLNVLSTLKSFLCNFLTLFNHILSQLHAYRCPIGTLDVISKFLKVLVSELEEHLCGLIILSVFKYSTVIKF